MEKFIYLFRGGTDTHKSAEERQAHMQKWFQWMQNLSQTGNFVGGDPLTGKGKQLSGSKKVLTDGPFTEAKECVGGYVIVNANDIDHAVEMAKGCPIFENEGHLEVRPIAKRDM